MNTFPQPRPSNSAKPGFIVFLAALFAGSLDIGQALLFSGPRVLLAVSAGLLGVSARQGGPAIYALGLALHFGIAAIFAAIYFFASKRLRFLLDYPLICGLIYGLLVDLSMTMIVLPLSALHARGPFPLPHLLLGMGVHMITVGLPIAFSVRSLSRNIG